MRRMLPLALAAAALGGCALPYNQVADDMAVCRRHAEQGPGGPSPMVGSGSFASFMIAHRGPAQRVSVKEAVYLDCMRVRGYGMPETQEPVDPQRVGTQSPSHPDLTTAYFP